MPNKAFPDDLSTVALASDDYFLIADNSDSDAIKRAAASAVITFLDDQYLNLTNTTPFTPSADYHPATKKYVDDKFATANEFTELTDTPSSYTSQAGKFLRVNATPDGVEFVSLTADLVGAGALNIGANAFTVNAIEIVGADGEVNKSAVEDSGNWDSAYSHISSDGTDHTYIDQDVRTTATPSFVGLTISTVSGLTVNYDSSQSFVGMVSGEGAIYLKDSTGTEKIRLRAYDSHDSYLSGNTTFGIANGTALGPVTVVGGGTYGNTLVLQANQTANTAKCSGVAFGRYANGTTYYTGMWGDSRSDRQEVYIGGGLGTTYCATAVRIFTGSGLTTVTGTERVFIDSSGLVTCTSSASSNGILTVTNAVNSGDVNHGTIRIVNTATDAVGNDARIMFTMKQAADLHPMASFGAVKESGAYSAGFQWNTRTGAAAYSEKMRLTSGGSLLINATTGVNPCSVGRYVYIADANHAGIVLHDTTAGAGYSTTIFSRDGHLDFGVHDTVKMRLSQSGYLSVGTTTQNKAGITIYDSSVPYLELYNSTSGQTATDGFMLALDGSLNAYVWNRENGPVIFGTNAVGIAQITTTGFEPYTDDTFYLGRNDDDSPKAWKGVILKDQTTGTYYRLQIDSGAVALIDLTD